MKNPKLTTSNGIPLALSNLYYRDECSNEKINDAVEDSRSAAELVKKINGLHLFQKFSIDRETPEYIRLISVDKLGNISYLRVEKN